MPDQKLTALTATTAPLSTDLMYFAKDPSGVPLSRSAEYRYVIGTGDARNNLIQNSPGQIVTDGAEPQWWDDVASATMTDEDAVGEGIPDITARVFKVVTIANDVYGYQTLTFADEEMLDAGITVVSLSCWVYCATGAKASIAINGANLGLQESGQVGAGAWELLTVENITLNGADVSIEVRLIVDTDTAWFTMPMLNLGSKPFPWMPRQEKFIPATSSTQYDLNTTGDVAWSDTDCTANTDPLATAVFVRLSVQEADGILGSTNNVGHSDDLTGGDGGACSARVIVLNIAYYFSTSRIACNDSQVIRYSVNEADADSDVRAIALLYGYWMWA